MARSRVRSPIHTSKGLVLFLILLDRMKGGRDPEDFKGGYGSLPRLNFPVFDGDNP
jgi:hypothetical protein